jgi:hypothetical protein
MENQINGFLSHSIRGCVVPPWLMLESPKKGPMNTTMPGQEGDGDIHETPPSRNPIKESHGHEEIQQLLLPFPWYLYLVGAAEPDYSV